jgi:hypothetical protein
MTKPVGRFEMKQGQRIRGFAVVVLVVAGVLLGAAVVFGDQISATGTGTTTDQGFRHPVGD